jgi:ABC-type multidrug transport system fused ATPase/permease subunit
MAARERAAQRATELEAAEEGAAHAGIRTPEADEEAAGAAVHGVPVVELKNVTKVYDGGVVGLERVSLKIGWGEFVFLVGPTGCGKSTCVRLLMKELEPSAGDIRISGYDLGDMPRRKVPHLRRNIGTIFQDFKLLPNRTVYANVAYSLEVIGESRAAIRRKVPDIPRTSCPGASSSASRSRAPSSIARRSSWPTSRPGISIRRRPSGSCS